LKRRLERRKRRKAARARRMTAATAPTAMPALAPVLRPLEPELAVVDVVDVEEAPETTDEVLDAAVDIATSLVVTPPPCDIVGAALGDKVAVELAKSELVVGGRDEESVSMVDETGREVSDAIGIVRLHKASRQVVDGVGVAVPAADIGQVAVSVHIGAEAGSIFGAPLTGLSPSPRTGARMFMMATTKARAARILLVVELGMVVVARPWL